MKNFLLGVAVVAVFGFGSLSALAQMGNGNGHGPNMNKLLCFSGTEDGEGYGGTCTMSGQGGNASAVLNTEGGDPQGEYAGVYTLTRSIYGRPLSSIAQLRFTYSGDPAGAGAPRFSVPIDTDGDGDTDLWAFISAFYCSDANGKVSATNTGCSIHTNTGANYTSLDALLAAYPNGKIATDNYVFIVADEPGTWTIRKVSFGPKGNNSARN